MLSVLSNKGKGMQSSSEQPSVGKERYVTTLMMAAKETSTYATLPAFHIEMHALHTNSGVS